MPQLKTTYDRVVAAFMNYHKGFRGKISLSGIKVVGKVFGRLREELKACDEAVRIKTDEYNKQVAEDKKSGKDKDQVYVSERIRNFQKEQQDMAEHFVVELSQEELDAVKKTVNEIVWPEETAEDKGATRVDSPTITNVVQFSDDLEKAV